MLRLARTRNAAGDAQAAAAALTHAGAALDAAARARHSPHGYTYLEGDAGPHALRAELAAAAGRGDAAAAAAHVAAAHVVALERRVAATPRGECELLYGRAGYLHACLVARAAAGAAAVPDALLSRLTHDILAAGADAADAAGTAFATRWGLLYTWHGADYLGAAHGLAGIALTLLHADAALAASGGGGGIPAREAARVRAATLALAGSLTRSGNLPTRYSAGGHDDRLVQWCHGAPGFLLLAAASVQHGGACGVPAASLAPAAAAAAECVWCDSMPAMLSAAPALTHRARQAARLAAQGAGAVPWRGGERVRPAGACSRLRRCSRHASRCRLRRLGCRAASAPRGRARPAAQPL